MLYIVPISGGDPLAPVIIKEKENPSKIKTKKHTGIAIGQVQSGSTSNGALNCRVELDCTNSRLFLLEYLSFPTMDTHFIRHVSLKSRLIMM